MKITKRNQKERANVKAKKATKYDTMQHETRFADLSQERLHATGTIKTNNLTSLAPLGRNFATPPRRPSDHNQDYRPTQKRGYRPQPPPRLL